MCTNCVYGLICWLPDPVPIYKGNSIFVSWKGFRRDPRIQRIHRSHPMERVHGSLPMDRIHGSHPMDRIHGSHPMDRIPSHGSDPGSGPGSGPRVQIWSHFWSFQKCSRKYCNRSGIIN